MELAHDYVRLWILVLAVLNFGVLLSESQEGETCIINN
jgi:hypothetical protein